MARVRGGGRAQRREGRALTAALLQVINRSSTELPLTVAYDKISLGRLRFWIHMQDAVYSLQQFGERRPGRGGPFCLAGDAALCLESTGASRRALGPGAEHWPCPGHSSSGRVPVAGVSLTSQPTCSAYVGSLFPQDFQRKTRMKSKAFSSTPTCTSWR